MRGAAPVPTSRCDIMNGDFEVCMQLSSLIEPRTVNKLPTLS